jgi:hypothetical protein
MVSWREGDKVQNVHIGSCRKLDEEAALQKARKMKAEATWMRSSYSMVGLQVSRDFINIK